MPDNNIPAKSLKTFTNRIIDYAGLFPPAKLPLGEAFANYVKYCDGSHNWILSNFIIPARQLPDLTKLIKELPEDNIMVYSFSILGRGGETEEEFVSGLKEDIELWKEFLSDNMSKVITDAYEVKLPIELIARQDADKIGKFIESVSDDITENVMNSMMIYFEGILGEEWKTDVKTVIEGIKIHNVNFNNAGYKLRTGGVTADAFPTVEQVCYALKECLNRQVPMKCTAGLHHPVRHFSNEVNAMMHGFLNIFGAGIIARRHNLSEHELHKILEDENPDNFIFTDEKFSWDKYEIGIEDIKFARKSLVTSFGSCSVDEPIEDLKKLNLL